MRAVRLEVAAASEHGWRLIGATCSPEEVTAQLAHGSTRSEGRVATITAAPQDDGAWSSLTVKSLVAHHADGSWPKAPGVATQRTCLAGGQEDSPTEIGDEPLPGDSAEEGPEEFEGWHEDELDSGEKGLRAEVLSDQWLASTGAKLSSPSLRTGDNRRSGPQATGELDARGPAHSAMAGIIAKMTRWDLVWASCTRGTVTARLRLVTDDGAAVVELRRDPSTDGRVEFGVDLPVPEGPDAAWVADQPPLSTSRCLRAPAPRGRLLIEGAPVGVTSRVQPMPS